MYLILGVVILSVIGLFVSNKFWISSKRKQRVGPEAKSELLGKHVLITGGSSGIGLSVAKEVAQRGANISIVARSLDKLESARREIVRHLSHPDKQKVVELSVDITSKSPGIVEDALKGLVDTQGPVFMLINCAGLSIPSKLETLTLDQIRHQMEVNFFGSATVTRALLPEMKSHSRGGCIVFVSSLAGLVGLYGFTAYSASKFAVRGFAEALAMEVSPYDITVTVNCPPDTDTPGLKEEDQYKPEETRIISQSAGLFKPEEVASTLVNDALNGKFLSTNGLDGFMLTQLCAGMGPSNFFQVLLQASLMGIFRIIAWGHVLYYNSIVKKCQDKRNQGKKTE